MFTAFVTDVYSRRILGWRTAAHGPTDVPLDALETALWTRAQADELVNGLFHHSDAGGQAIHIDPLHQPRLTDADAVATIGTIGDTYDNALVESVIGLYKTECIHFEAPGAASTTSSWPH